MYLPSLGTGLLVDKVGRTGMVIASGITLSIAGLIAAFSPGDSLVLADDCVDGARPWMEFWLDQRNSDYHRFN